MIYRVWMFIIVFFVCCIAGCTGKRENTELKQLFDLNWKFHQGDNPSAFEVKFNDTQWRNLDLPHDWSTDGKLNQTYFVKENGDSSISDISWYRKKFVLPPEWQNRRVAIYFEGVKAEIQVYLNENILAVNTSASDSYHYDLTPYLNQSNKNIIAVRVNCTHYKNGRWNKGTGIHRHVWLMVADPV